MHRKGVKGIFFGTGQEYDKHPGIHRPYSFGRLNPVQVIHADVHEDDMIFPRLKLGKQFLSIRKTPDSAQCSVFRCKPALYILVEPLPVNRQIVYYCDLKLHTPTSPNTYFRA